MAKLPSYFFLLLVFGCAGLFSSCQWIDGKPRVLVFSNEEIVLHESTAVAMEALEQLCAENGLRADVRDIAKVSKTFTESSLRRYAAVVFLNTAGNMLNAEQERDFERYIKAGGGFVGIHTAIDTEHKWTWYGKLVGAHFNGQTEVEEARLQVQNREHPATRHLDAEWSRRDEWFNLHDLDPGVEVLLTLDETSCQGGTMGSFHPVSWCHEFDGGRAFVTTMGHTPESYNEPAFLQHLLGGIQYAIGENRGLNYDNIPEQEASETVATGFVKTTFECDLDEPLVLEMLPDGNLVFIERKGAIKRYDVAAQQLHTVAQLSVHVINELGLLGMALDPQWEQNHWIYLYYTRPGTREINRLSRFVFTGDSLLLDSETILLEVGLERDECCHYAGYLKFDAQGYLYLSTGDNTDYDGSEGYSPIDERPDQTMGDAQRSAANSMDLRGKILRIKPLPDGSYLCPAGNMFSPREVTVSPLAKALDAYLFPNNQTAPCLASHNTGRPEVYVMGCRNPFRFSIDNRRGWLFWGEPGPQAGVPDPKRGPQGFDEINCARAPGFFGWPYFIGDNKSYVDYDFEQKKSGAHFDAQHPVNDSPRNTGATYLPPAQPALIWYSYGSSVEFPLLANGANCAMAGPVYYSDQYPVESRFPDKYNGNLIIYDWMRNWVMAVTLDSLGRFEYMEPLAESIELSKPVDMLFDKNGALWVLEYGNKWFTQNADACLSRIDYIPGDGIEEQVAENAAPDVYWNFGGKNRSFYQPGEMAQYQLVANDPEDGSLADGRIQPADMFVHIGYMAPGADWQKQVTNLKPQPTPFARGKQLIEGSDCTSCHAADRKVNGPAYLDVKRRYQGDKSAQARLVQKIIKGGKGVWGETVMSAHPQLAPADVADMVRWILSLGDYETPAAQGIYRFNPPADKEDGGIFVFHAAYQDRGSRHGQPRTGSETLVLRPTTQLATQADDFSKAVRIVRHSRNNTMAVMAELKDQCYLVFKQIDLRELGAVIFGTVAAEGSMGEASVEIRLDNPDGQLVGKAHVPGYAAVKKNSLSELSLEIDRNVWSKEQALHDLYIVLRNPKNPSVPAAYLDWLRFEFYNSTL
ncbi:MAG: ThuA domain-containing protein [Lewinellaceae bacterium]|nr:ThuA domain-containing protein [Lewinellaceae bacterium]